jgi:hypothetical protein
MNIEYPHDIVSEKELRRRPPAEQAKYVPVNGRYLERLRSMTAEQRAGFLRQHPVTPEDIERLRRAAEKRERKASIRAALKVDES